MQTYLLSRVAAAIPTIFGITVLIFVAMRILPGDPIAVIASEGAGTQRLSDEQLAYARASLGLDRPYWLQYASWMGDVARGNFGTSFWRGEPISEVILRRGPITGQIAIMAIAISWALGVPIGLLSAVKRNTPLEYVVRVL